MYFVFDNLIFVRIPVPTTDTGRDFEPVTSSCPGVPPQTPHVGP